MSHADTVEVLKARVRELETINATLGGQRDARLLRAIDQRDKALEALAKVQGLLGNALGIIKAATP